MKSGIEQAAKYRPDDLGVKKVYGNNGRPNLMLSAAALRYLETEPGDRVQMLRGGAEERLVVCRVVTL